MSSVAQDGIAEIIKMCGFRIAKKKCILVLAGIPESATISTDYVFPYEQLRLQLVSSIKMGKSWMAPLYGNPALNEYAAKLP